MKCLIGRAAFSQPQIAFALERFECAQQNGLSTALSARFEETVERGQRAWSDPPVWNQIGIISAIIYLRKQV